MPRNNLISELTKYMIELHTKERGILSDIRGMQEELSSIEEQRKATETILKKCRNGDDHADIRESVVADLKQAKSEDKTQSDVIEMIALRHGGILKVSYAKQLMMEAGFVSKPKNEPPNIYALISRDEKWERLNPGEYRLLSPHEAEMRQGFNPSEWEREQQQLRQKVDNMRNESIECETKTCPQCGEDALMFLMPDERSGILCIRCGKDDFDNNGDAVRT